MALLVIEGADEVVEDKLDGGGWGFEAFFEERSRVLRRFSSLKAFSFLP